MLMKNVSYDLEAISWAREVKVLWEAEACLPIFSAEGKPMSISSQTSGNTSLPHGQTYQTGDFGQHFTWHEA